MLATHSDEMRKVYEKHIRLRKRKPGGGDVADKNMHHKTNAISLEFFSC